MSRATPRPCGGAVRLLFGLGLAVHAALPGGSQTQAASDLNGNTSGLPGAWKWMEHCHVLRDHDLSDFGTHGSLLVTGDAQAVLSSPLAGKNRTGYSYIATLKQDLWSGAALIAYAQGGVAYTLDGLIEDALSTNGLAQPADFYISHLFFLQNFASRHVQLAAGRIDLSDWFDTNAAANCEIVQFLSASLVNDPLIPFPQPGTGVAARLVPIRSFYVQAAAADAAADALRPDFDTAFRSLDDIFSIFEFSLMPSSGKRGGTYRFMFWHNPASGWSGPGKARDNHGFAGSFDQPATGRLTLFFRYGWADAPVDTLTDFVSAGVSLAGPWPGREHDTLRAGMAWGGGTARDETLVEVDYSLHVTDRLALTPLVQIIANPAQNPRDDTFAVAGLRAVYVF
jgi:hypothetical protein